MSAAEAIYLFETSATQGQGGRKGPEIITDNMRFSGSIIFIKRFQFSFRYYRN
jgi:hypothetical protein